MVTFHEHDHEKCAPLSLFEQPANRVFQQPVWLGASAHGFPASLKITLSRLSNLWLAPSDWALAISFTILGFL